jgi:hypothetical protein
VIYEYIDELAVFPGELDELERSHNELVRSADVVLATADKLYQRLATIRGDALLCPNAVDYEHIQKTIQDTAEPPDDLKIY